MNRKVWVIGERDWHQPDSRPDRQRKRKKAAAGTDVRKEKSPAVALSLSLLVWGGGHIYIGRYRTGFVLFAAMLLTLAALAGTILPGGLSGGWAGGAAFAGLGVSPVVMFPAILCVSFYASVDSYLHAHDKRNDPYRGIDNEYGSLLASLVLPGWGQFLNGQAGKGIFFGVVGLLGYASILIMAGAWRLWHLPAAAGADLARAEMPIMAALFAMPLLLLLWIVNVHDAYWTCRYPRLKKPMRDRVRFVLERVRRRGIVKGVFRELRGLVLLTLLLCSVLAVAGASFSADAYAVMMTDLAGEMETRGMRTLPGLLTGIFK